MSHISENAARLELTRQEVESLEQLIEAAHPPGTIYLIYLSLNRTDSDASQSASAYASLTAFCEQLPEDAVVCVLSMPSDAARLHAHLESFMEFHFWSAVKLKKTNSQNKTQSRLPEEHAALLVLSKYKGSLRHTKTRVAYTYCRSCGKTTKDYGGKKHLYHLNGTLLSDVWRDIEITSQNVYSVVDRLQDLFGLKPYRQLAFYDCTKCTEPLVSNRSPKTSVKKEGDSFSSHMRSRLINDDCIKALQRMKADTVDFCFADLPYNLNKDYSGYNDTLETQEYFKWCDSWLCELARILKPGRTCAILNIPLWSIRHYQYLSTLLNYQNWIVWDALAFPARRIMPAHYAILCFTKGESRTLPGLASQVLLNEKENISPLADGFCIRTTCVKERHLLKVEDKGSISDLWLDIHRLKHNSRRVDHPCQLPPALMRRLYTLFTLPGEMVLDCFNGAGTSTLVAAQMARKYIGIEKSTEYHLIAQSRHAELEQGLDPFRKRNAIPKSKNSPVKRMTEISYAVSKKDLQLEVKRIAEAIGRLPTKQEVAKQSRFPFEYFESYFVSWGEACAAARTTGMSEYPLPLQRILTNQISLFDSTNKDYLISDDEKQE